MPPRTRTGDTAEGTTTREQSQQEAEAQVSKAFDGSQVLDIEPEEGVVIYAGPASTRSITSDHWSRAGVQDVSGTVWNIANEFRVPKSQFTEKQLEILAKDKSFKIG